MYVCMYVLWIIDQPGLLGPHFPQLLCVTGMARAEVLSYFRHAQGDRTPSTFIHTYIYRSIICKPVQFVIKSVCGLFFCMYVCMYVCSLKYICICIYSGIYIFVCMYLFMILCMHAFGYFH